MIRIKTIAIALAVGAVVTTGLVTGHAVTAPIGTGGVSAPTSVACSEEDGSTPGQAFPCLWDAQAQGNGTGESYLLLAAADGVSP